MDTQKIATIINNEPLASDINRSISLALASPSVYLVGLKTVFNVFRESLEAAGIRDIERHPRGKLFTRLIEYGPRNPDEPAVPISDNETVLSDPECESCVEFIYSHMVNRFKGELAELLALEPCIELVERLRKEKYPSADVHLYWGETIREPRVTRTPTGSAASKWGDFAKGADGLIVERVPTHGGRSSDRLRILGAVEVKSMARTETRIIDQIDRHIRRLDWGVKLGGTIWNPDDLVFTNQQGARKDEADLMSVMVTPSKWRLPREYHREKTDNGYKLVFPRGYAPPKPYQIKELGPRLWKITLAWSVEALNQAAYEMTFWYMSQVGRHIYKRKKLPKEWNSMTPEEAGYNAVKMMLYYMPLRHISKRHKRLATRLYNIYCFGYPLGADSKEILWPEDLADENTDEP